MAARGSRKSRALLVVALLASLGLVGGVVAVRWRARLPRVLHVSLGDWSALKPRRFVLTCPEVSFVGADRLLVAEKSMGPDRFPVVRGHVWSIATGRLERTFAMVPTHEPGSLYALVGEPDEDSALVDLVTGATTPLDGVKGGHGSLTAAGDVVAFLGSDGASIETRRTGDGSRLRVQPLPEYRSDRNDRSTPRQWSLCLSPHGEHVAIKNFEIGLIWACNLTSGDWWPVERGKVLGFAPGGPVVDTPSEGGHRIVLRSPNSEARLLAATPLTGAALSASGELLASVQSVGDAPDRAVVVARVATGEVIRRVALAAGGELRCLALSPEGERLAIAFADGRVEVWELP